LPDKLYLKANDAEWGTISYCIIKEIFQYFPTLQRVPAILFYPIQSSISQIKKTGLGRGGSEKTPAL